MYYRPEDVELRIGDHTIKSQDINWEAKGEPDMIFFDEVSKLKAVDYKRITDYLDRHPELNIHVTSPSKIDVRQFLAGVDFAHAEQRVLQRLDRPFYIKKSNYTLCPCGKKRSTIAKHCQHCGRTR